MEQIISAGGKGVLVENDNSATALARMKDIAIFEKCLGEKIPGMEFEAAKISCTRKDKYLIKKRIRAVHSWIRYIQIPVNEEYYEELVLTPSLKAIDEMVHLEKITREDMERYAGIARNN